jgi:hypothetical protein
MKQRNLVLAITGAVLLIGGWYAFRPERAFLDKTVNESFAAAAPASSELSPTKASGPAVLLAGTFHTNAHHTEGTATIYQNADGSRTLRLTGFETSNGPDVRVYLVAASDVNDAETVKRAGFVELGALKGNKGDQNYDVPATIDLAKHRAVTIWCRRFSVNFGSAPLSSM